MLIVSIPPKWYHRSVFAFLPRLVYCLISGLAKSPLIRYWSTWLAASCPKSSDQAPGGPCHYDDPATNHPAWLIYTSASPTSWFSAVNRRKSCTTKTVLSWWKLLSMCNGQPLHPYIKVQVTTAVSQNSVFNNLLVRDRVLQNMKQLIDINFLSGA